MLNRTFAEFDVVAVPDFSTPARSMVFEARTLFFLASWLENAGAARALPLHLACIGEPPRGVRRLAGQCGATVTICEPLGLTGSLTANKLRGLELPGRFERVLMLDTDVFILGDFSSLAREVSAGLSAAPAGSKWVPEALWQRIYGHLEIPLPVERIPLLAAQYDLLKPSEMLHREFGQTTNLQRMLPYYNSGVFLAPRDGGLREVWADHLVRLAGLFAAEPDSRAAEGPSTGSPPLWRRLSRAAGRNWRRLTKRRQRYPRSVTTCDQATFSTAFQRLRGDGVTFQPLPDKFHARGLHCRAGRLRLDEMKIYHATGFLRPEKRERWDLDRMVERGIQAWQENFRAGGRHRGQCEEAEKDARRAGEFVRRLLREHVRPALA